MKEALFEDVLCRLAEVVGLQAPKDLAAALEISEQAVYKASRARKIPSTWVYRTAKNSAVSRTGFSTAEGSYGRTKVPTHRRKSVSADARCRRRSGRLRPEWLVQHRPCGSERPGPSGPRRSLFVRRDRPGPSMQPKAPNRAMWFCTTRTCRPSWMKPFTSKNSTARRPPKNTGARTATGSFSKTGSPPTPKACKSRIRKSWPPAR